jgi:hypothetical protein
MMRPERRKVARRIRGVHQRREILYTDLVLLGFAGVYLGEICP